MSKPQQKQPGIYRPLPEKLGGSGSRSSKVPLRSALPLPQGAKLPAEEDLNSKVRNRVLLLEGDAKPKEDKPSAKRPRRTAPGKVVLPKAEQKYELYIPLMTLWKDYAAKLVQDEKISNYGDRVLRMDLHGAPVEVVRAKDPGLVGISGILVAETANTVIIVTKKDRAVTVPKNVAVIRTMFGSVQVEISLPALQFRASERSARKMKKRHFPPL